MKPSLSRLASTHPLALIAGACLIALTIPAYRWLDAERASVGAVPRAIAAEGDKTRAFLGEQIAAARERLLGFAGDQAQELRIDLFTEIGSTRSDLFGLAKQQLNDFRTAADARIGDTLGEVHGAIGQVHELNGKLGPLLDASSAAVSSVGGLADAYRTLPDRVGAELRPSWLAMQPEITCRQLDGAGYGGCWHSRITALMGEAANMGGVFTKHFPAFADSTSGIAADVHVFTSKAIAPRGFWGTVKDVFSTGSGVTRALGAAGVFDRRAAFKRLPPFQAVQTSAH